jgi:two-component system LytT family response regulator
MEEKLKCVIVDDESNAVELLAALLADLYEQVEITGKYHSWKDALNGLRQRKPDILLLDISMPGKSGIDMLRLLSDIDFEVIFITAHAEYALDAFRFFATGYLLKPVDEQDLVAVMDKAIERIGLKRKQGAAPVAASPEHPMKLGIPNSKGIDYVNLSDILYFESCNKYTKVVTKAATLLSPYNIGSFKKLVASDLFYPVHQSWLVNLLHVVRFDANGCVVMTDKKEIPVARSVKKDFLRHFITASKLK